MQNDWFKRHWSMAAEDRGSVLLWGLGLFLMAMTTIGVLVSVVGMTERAAVLQFLNDKAVLAASNRLNFEDFYQTGSTNDIQIDQVKAQTRVKEIFAEADFVISSFVLKANRNEVSLTSFTRYELLNFAGNQIVIALRAVSSATIWSP